MLFELARRRKRVLHVEFIGLMTPSHQAYREMSQNLGGAFMCLAPVVTIVGWVMRQRQAGWGSLLNGRLQALHHLFGHLSLTHAALERRPDGYELSVELVTKTGIDIMDHYTRQVDCRRVREPWLTITMTSDYSESNQKPVALFEADLSI